MSPRDPLIALFAQRAYRRGNFVLSSGAKSDFYLDAKQVTYHPEGVQLVGRAVLAAVQPFGVQAVGGLTMGADAVVVSTVWASVEAGRPLSGFIVRKEPKQHGLQQWIEGISPTGLSVAIVEDVVTSGASALKAAQIVREAGAKVAVVVGLIDRQQGGAAAIEQFGVPFRSICTIEDIKAAAANAQASTAI